jgi:hypothetical protein
VGVPATFDICQSRPGTTCQEEAHADDLANLLVTLDLKKPA